MSTEEKNMDELLRKVEHPKEYSDDQLEKLMADSDNREIYNLMVDAENVYRKDDELSDEDIDNEWQKISAKGTIMRRRAFLYVAAAVLGFVLISGIAYAAIIIGSNRTAGNQTRVSEQTTEKTLNIKTSRQDSTVQSKPEIKEYRDATLETVIGDIATYYNREVNYADKDVRSVRIYTKWNQAESLEATIEKLNHFEKFTISIEDNKIIVR